MKSMPTVENAATWFNAKTVTHHLDVVDRQAASIVDTRTVEGSTVRFYNADGFDSLFGRKSVGTRHAEDGRLYAILKDGDSTREEPVDLFPFADVQVGPTCKFGRRITKVVVEYGPADVTATRPYSESEADWLL